MTNAERLEKLEHRMQDLYLEIGDYRQLRSAVILTKVITSREPTTHVVSYIDNQIHGLQVKIERVRTLKAEYSTTETEAVEEKEITGVLYIGGKAV